MGSGAGYTLLPGSPAIDAGNNALAVDANGDPLTSDQRGDGYARIVGSAVDIGAVEVNFRAVETGFVVGRHLFYNNSGFDRTDDYEAVATDKEALLPGELVSPRNYTSYVRGINGIIFDLAGDCAVSADDLVFRVGNDNETTDWSDAPAPLSIQTLATAGFGASTRTTVIWEDHAITNTWLQVTILANEDTGLDVPDVFYFGNAVGETGNSEADARVTAADEILVRNNRRGRADRAGIEDRYDFNRDGLVNVADRLIARNHRTGLDDALKLIMPDTHELLVNGGFESGDFTGWTATTNGIGDGGTGELTPWTVGQAGGGFFFNSMPLEGAFSAYNGFDGQAGLTYELRQSVDIPLPDESFGVQPLLIVNYRVVMAYGTEATQGRKVEVLLRGENGDLLDTLYSWEITPQPGPAIDLGWKRLAFWLPDYIGQTIELCLREEIPETHTGPALIEWDAVSLTVIEAP